MFPAAACRTVYRVRHNKGTSQHTDPHVQRLAETNPIHYDRGGVAGHAGAMLMLAQCLCRRDAMRPPARPPQEMMMRRLVVPFVPFGALLFVATAGVALAQEGAPLGAPAGGPSGGAALPGRA